MLTWSLVMSTYNRGPALKRCVELVLQQTRLPKEIIVIDASDPWKENRQLTVEDAIPRHPDIRWEYEQARVRSLTAQRNQGLAMARSDVLFLIDDDAFMYPDCAEEILKVYEADPERAVAGVAPIEASRAPGDPAAPAEPTDDRPPAGLNPFRRFLAYWETQVDVDRLLLPYDPEYPDRPVPPGVLALGAFRARHFNGFRMTFRREPIQREGFDETLKRYAAAEDLDASYRVSRHGALAITPRARIFHSEDPSGRLTRYTRYALGLINMGVLLSLKGYDPSLLLHRYRKLVGRRIWVDLLRDVGRRRFSLPYVRAARFALGVIKSLAERDVADLKAWFPAFQTELIERNPS